MSSHPAGWYPDPFGRFEHRYFNGSMWTADVSNGGERMVDPIGAASPVGGAYQPVAADASAAARRGNGMGITAMILGIVAVTTAWIPFAFVAGALCGVLAIIFGIVARRRRKGRGGSPSGTVGLILGPVALLFAVGGVALTWVVLDVIRPGRYEIASTSCEAVGGRQVYQGEIRNGTGRTRSYTIHVEFVRSGTNNVQDTASTDVHDVPGGDSAPWTVSVRNSSGTDLECRVSSVVGTFDFLD